MANTNDTVRTRGRLIYIEPNEFAAQKGAQFGDGVKADNICWDPEELNMAVDLQVVIPRRDDCGTNTEFDVTIDGGGSTFLHNFVSFFGGTKVGEDSLKSSDRMLTDSYTDISYNEIRSGYRSDKECLGISSIDIKFDSHFYPVVHMRFTDIRGYSLFMPAEKQYVDELNHKYAYKNFFQSVFHFPYPRFLLTIKGFYGTKVTFILAVDEFKSSLNANTGNIDVDISFIGYMYGLYTEIPMTMVLCAPYIDLPQGLSVSIDNVDSVYGDYWSKSVEEGRFVTMDDGTPLPTMLEYLVKYMQVTDNIDYDALSSISAISENKQEQAMLEDLKVQLGLVKKNMASVRNKSMRNGTFLEDVEFVAESENGEYDLFKIKDDVVDEELRKRYKKSRAITSSSVLPDIGLSDTDGGVFNNVIMESDLLDNVKVLNNKISEYNSADYRALSELPYPFYNSNGKLLFFNFYKGKIVKAQPPILYDETLNEKRDVRVGDMINSAGTRVGTMSVSEVEALFPSEASKFSEARSIMIEKEIDFSDSGTPVYEQALEKYELKTAYHAYAVFGYKKLYNDIVARIKECNGADTTLRREANDEVTRIFSDALGFKLDLENTYRMIFAHIDCFMTHLNTMVLTEVMKLKNSGTRTFNDLGLKYDERQTDIKAKDNTCFVPPFFALYNEERQVEYPGDTTVGTKPDKLAEIHEVQFVDRLNDAAKMCGKVYASVEELMRERVRSSVDENGVVSDVTTNLTWKYNCCTDFLFGTKNPYTVLDYTDPDVKFIDVLYILHLRLLNFAKFGVRKDEESDIRKFVDTELENIKNALPSCVSNSMYNQMVEYNLKDFEKIASKFNSDLKSYKERRCDIPLIDECGNGYGLKGIPVQFNDNPLYSHSSGEYLTFDAKGGIFIIKNYDAYKGQLDGEQFKPHTNPNMFKENKVKNKSAGPLSYNSVYIVDGQTDIYSKYGGDFSKIMSDYQIEKEYDNNFWFPVSLTEDKKNNNFWYRVCNGEIRRLIKSFPSETSGVMCDPDGTEVWNNLNGIDVTNEQLSVACYLLSALQIPYESNPFAFLTYYNSFRDVPKVMLLYLGSLIFRARKILQFGGRDKIYCKEFDSSFTSLTEKIFTSLIQSNDIMSFDEKFRCEGSDVNCLKHYIGYYSDYLSKYLAMNDWFDDNNKYATLESYFCTWVTEEFLDVYMKYVKNPELKRGGDNTSCGFAEHFYDNSKKVKQLTINQGSGLNDFLCDIVTKQEKVLIPECYNASGKYDGVNGRYIKIGEVFKNAVTNLCQTYANEKHEDEMFAMLRETDKGNLELKKALYYSLKNLYDKWICSYGSIEKFKLQTADEDRSVQKTRYKEGSYDSNATREYNNFLYVDSFYNCIGDKFMVNPRELFELILRYSKGDRNNSVYEFMAEIAEKNKLLMIALPVYTNFYKADEVKEIFTPHEIYNANRRQSDGFNNTYVIMYTHEASKHLDDISDEEIGYEGDGFDLADSAGRIGELPAQIYDEKTGDLLNLSVNAFGVTYAMQNQSYFKNISVNMDNPIVTDYSIANQLQLSQTAAHGDIYYPFGIGQNIYSIYSNRSYTCTVEMMGCANIMPMMYFQLNNVPMFKGAYMIVSVSHQIKAGNMTTTFTGIRQSKYLQPFNQNIFDVTDIIQQMNRGGAGSAENGVKKKDVTDTSVKHSKNVRNAGAVETKHTLLYPGSVQPMVKLNEKYKAKNGVSLFPIENGETVIPISMEEMEQYMESVTVKVHKSQTEDGEITFKINRGIVADVKKAFDQAFSKKVRVGNEDRKIVITKVAGFDWRSTSKGSTSMHAYGLAIDVNACGAGNPRKKSFPANDNFDTENKFRTWNHPFVVSMNENGIGWLYNTDGNSAPDLDTMHFSVYTYYDSNGHLIGR